MARTAISWAGVPKRFICVISFARRAARQRAAFVFAGVRRSLWSTTSGDLERGNAGWSSPVARQAHNLKVVGSNPAPATKFSITNQRVHPSPCRGRDCFRRPASTWRVHERRDRVRRPSFAGCAFGSAGNRVAEAGASANGCRFTVRSQIALALSKPRPIRPSITHRTDE